MIIDFSKVNFCPICGAERWSKNACQPIEFKCGSYVYESKKNIFHFNQNKGVCEKKI